MKDINTMDDIVRNAQQSAQQTNPYLEALDIRIPVTSMEYDTISNMLSKASKPEEEAYKIASALSFSRNTKLDFPTAYANLDKLTEAQLGIKYVPNQTSFKAIQSSYKLGELSMQRGNLGLQYKDAWQTGDTATMQAIEQQIQAIDEQMMGMQDGMPKGALNYMLQVAAQNIPYMSSVFTKGAEYGAIGTIAGTAVAKATVASSGAKAAMAAIGGSIGLPAMAGITAVSILAAAYGRFKAASKVTEGNEFYDMIHNEGINPEVAWSMSTLSGNLSGAIEAILGDTITAGLSAMGIPLDSIASQLTTRLYVSGKLGKLGKFATDMGISTISEGAEEAVDSFASDAVTALGRLLSDLNPNFSLSESSKKAGKEFIAGAAANLIYGPLPTALNVRSEIKNLQSMRNLAVVTPSKEVFMQMTENVAPEGMDNKDWYDVRDHIYEKAENARNVFGMQEYLDTAEMDLPDIDEVSDAEGAEEQEATKPRSGKVDRKKDGSLNLQRSDKSTRLPGDEGYRHIMKIGSANSSERYGHIEYDVKGNDLTIRNVRFYEEYSDLREEAVRDFLLRNRDYDIHWDTDNDIDEEVKQNLIKNNPSGPEAGLQYGSTEFNVDDNIAVQKKLNLKQFSNNPTEIKTMATLVQMQASTMGLTGEEFIDKYLGGEIRNFRSAKLDAARLDAGRSLDPTEEELDAISRGELEEITEDSIIPGGLREKLEGVDLDMEKRAMTIWKGTRAIVYAGTYGNPTSFEHEMVHVIMRLGEHEDQFQQVYDKVRDTEQFKNYVDANHDIIHATSEDLANLFNGEWGNDEHEFVADLFESYRRNEQSMDTGLRHFFHEVANWFRQIYNTLKNAGNLNDEVREYFDSFYGTAEDLRANRGGEGAEVRSRSDEMLAQKAMREYEALPEDTKEFLESKKAEEVPYDAIPGAILFQKYDGPIPLENMQKFVQYKVAFIRKDNPGHLYTAMVGFPGQRPVPLGVATYSDTGEVGRDRDGNIVLNTLGRASVKVGGKGTRGTSSSNMSWRPANHTGSDPQAVQFLTKDGKYPWNIVFLKEYVYSAYDYTIAAMEYGMTEKGKFIRTRAGLPYLPYDGHYFYRTSPNPKTVPWMLGDITEVFEILDDADRKILCEEAGIPYIEREGGDIDLEKWGLKHGLIEKPIDADDLPARVDHSNEARFLPGYTPHKVDFTLKAVQDEFKLNGLDINDYLDWYDTHEVGELSPYDPENSTNKKDDVLFQSIGFEGAQNLDLSDSTRNSLIEQYDEALNMERKGTSASDIKLKTGWERGIDGDWRMDLPDKKEYFTFEALKGSLPATLLDIYKNEELYKAYPFLKDTKIFIDPSISAAAVHNSEANSIGIHPIYGKLIRGEEINDWNYVNVDLNELPGILVHEIQHAIQSEEGWAQGGSSGIYHLIKEKYEEMEPEKKELQLREQAVKLASQGFKHLLDLKNLYSDTSPKKTLKNLWTELTMATQDEIRGLSDEQILERMKTDEYIGYLKNYTKKCMKQTQEKFPNVFKNINFEDPLSSSLNAIRKANKLASDMGTELKEQIVSYKNKTELADKYEALLKLDYYEPYRRLAGEIEARATEKKLSSEKDPTQTLTTEFEDVPRIDSIVIHDYRNNMGKDIFYHEPRILFQSADQDTTVAEANGSLILTHNLSSSHIADIKNIGGLPMPSLAITKPELQHKLDLYGDVTLLGNEDLAKRLIDSNSVYDRDVWSPMVPDPDYEVDKEVLKARLKELEVDKYIDVDRMSEKMWKDPFMLAAFKITAEQYKELGTDIDTLYKDLLEVYTPMLMVNGEMKEYNAENILERMKQSFGELVPEEHIDPEEIAASQEFTSMEHLRDSADRITRDWTDGEYEEYRRIIDKAYNADWFDSIQENLMDYFIKNRVDTDDSIIELMDSSDVEYTNENFQDIKDYIKVYYRNIHQDYFEAKPQEVLQFSDFSAAMIPSDLPESDKAILRDAGLELVEYSMEDRIQITQEYVESHPSLLFQERSYLDDMEEYIPFAESFDDLLGYMMAMTNFGEWAGEDDIDALKEYYYLKKEDTKTRRLENPQISIPETTEGIPTEDIASIFEVVENKQDTYDDYHDPRKNTLMDPDTTIAVSEKAKDNQFVSIIKNDVQGFLDLLVQQEAAYIELDKMLEGQLLTAEDIEAIEQYRFRKERAYDDVSPFIQNIMHSKKNLTATSEKKIVSTVRKEVSAYRNIIADITGQEFWRNTEVLAPEIAEVVDSNYDNMTVAEKRRAYQEALATVMDRKIKEGDNSDLKAYREQNLSTIKKLEEEIAELEEKLKVEKKAYMGLELDRQDIFKKKETLNKEVSEAEKKLKELEDSINTKAKRSVLDLDLNAVKEAQSLKDKVKTLKAEQQKLDTEIKNKAIENARNKERLRSKELANNRVASLVNKYETKLNDQKDKYETKLDTQKFKDTMKLDSTIIMERLKSEKKIAELKTRYENEIAELKETDKQKRAEAIEKLKDKYFDIAYEESYVQLWKDLLDNKDAKDMEKYLHDEAKAAIKEAKVKERQKAWDAKEDYKKKLAQTKLAADWKRKLDVYDAVTIERWKSEKSKNALRERYEQKLEFQKQQSKIDARHAKEAANRKLYDTVTMERYKASKNAEAIRANLEEKIAKLKEKQKLERELRKEDSYRQALVHSIMKPVAKSIAIDEAEQIQAIQAGIDPHNRKSMTFSHGAKVDINYLKRLFAKVPDDPIFALLKPEQLERLSQLSLDEMTTDTLEDLQVTVDALRQLGRRKRQAYIDMQQRNVSHLIRLLTRQLMDSGKYIHDPIKGTKEEQKRKNRWVQRAKDIYGATINMARKAQMLDGDTKGIFYNFLIRKKRELQDLTALNVTKRVDPILDMMKELGVDNEDLYQNFTVTIGDEARTYDLSSLMYVYFSQFNDKNVAAVAFGELVGEAEKSRIDAEAWKMYPEKHNAKQREARSKYRDEQISELGLPRYEELLGQAKNIVQSDERIFQVAKAIEKDFNSESFARVVELMRRMYNIDVKREDYYLPINREEFNGEEPGIRLKNDILGIIPGTKGAVEKGFTKERIEMNAYHQKRISMDFFGLWQDSVFAQEHALANMDYVRELNSVFLGPNSSMLRDAITNIYGDNMLSDIETHIKEISNPKAYERRGAEEGAIRILRGNLYSAYLGYKASGVILQGITSPAPFLGKVNPIELMKGYIALMLHPIEAIDTINALSPFMRDRSFDIIGKQIKDELHNMEVDSLGDKAKKFMLQFQNIGMMGLELIDRYAVAGGWLAIYNKNLAAGMDPKEAIRDADEYVRETQPLSDITELAPMFKHRNQAMQTLTAFQSSMNVIWNNCSYDIRVDAFKRHNFKQAIGTVVGYMLAGALLELVREGFTDDDDKPLEGWDLMRRLVYSFTTQPVSGIPLVADFADAIAERVITGEKPHMYHSDMYPTVSSVYKAIDKAMDGDTNKALQYVMDAVALATGMPKSGINELKQVKKIGFEALLGRRDYK